MQRLLVLALFVAACLALVPLTTVEEPVPNEYVVVLKDSVTALEGNSHIKQMLAQDRTNVMTARYTIINGYAGKFTDATVEWIRNSEEVSIVAQDGYVHAQQVVDCDEQMTGLWNLDRIDQRFLPLTNHYDHDRLGGDTVEVFVIDTGIMTSVADFQGRAYFSPSADFTPEGVNDRNGHGTHVAGTVGSTTFGIAKSVILQAVKVLDGSGSGQWSWVINGIDYVGRQPAPRKIANLSLGGGIYVPADQAVTNLVNTGVIVACAAGNNNGDACNFSPARAPGAIGIGATTNIDFRSTFSNFGTCVKIFAPGTSVTSTWINPPYQNTLSGTSMASPHIAGICAVIWSQHRSLSAREVEQRLFAGATAGVVINPGAGSPNLFVYSPCELGPAE